jgi:protein TonB
MVALMILAMMAATATDRAHDPVPLQPLFTWVMNDDYPTEAMSHDAQGTVAFRLDIDANGVPTGCTVTTSSGSSALDDTTCRIMRERARFSPARNESDRPVAGTFASRITWRMQEDPEDDGGHHPTFAPTIMTTTMHKSAGGEIDCTFAYNGQPSRLGIADQCAFFRNFDADRALRAIDGDAVLTMTFSTTPSGSQSLPEPTQAGDLIFMSQASIDVAPDGRITDCRPTERQSLRVLEGLGLPDLCTTYSPDRGPAFRPDHGRTDIQTGRVGAMIYLRQSDRRTP